MIGIRHIQIHAEDADHEGEEGQKKCEGDEQHRGVGQRNDVGVSEGEKDQLPEQASCEDEQNIFHDGVKKLVSGIGALAQGTEKQIRPKCLICLEKISK